MIVLEASSGFLSFIVYGGRGEDEKRISTVFDRCCHINSHRFEHTLPSYKMAFSSLDRKMRRTSKSVCESWVPAPSVFAKNPINNSFEYIRSVLKLRSSNAALSTRSAASYWNIIRQWMFSCSHLCKNLNTFKFVVTTRLPVCNFPREYG